MFKYGVVWNFGL